MISDHDEIEAKLAAEGVSVPEFVKWMLGQAHIERYLRVIGPDHYFESGANVVRHRESRHDKRHELTVKRRKSDGSTRDRLEVDLHFSNRTAPVDVATFLKATGFVHVFTLVKEAHIFWVNLTDNLTATFVIYDVWREAADGKKTEQKRFVEVEAEKGSNVSSETAKRHIRAQVKLLQEKFGLGEPLNDSLYEIYSGRRYQTL